MKIPFLELKPAYLELKEELDAAYHRVMDSGWYLLGAELEAFEQEYANYCESNYCVGVGSGLDALHLVLRACGIGEGHEVIVPAHTFIATWLAVTHTGAIPVPVEPDPSTYNIDVNQIEAAITNRTKVIVPVHLYGQPADMDAIMEIANQRGLLVIEDSAQAQGSRYKGRRTGGLGHVAAHSFYPGKNLGAFGDGGAVTTNDPKIADSVRVLRNYGSRKKYHYEVAGVNSRLDELQSSFLRVRLRHLDRWNDRRRAMARLYLESLSPLATRDSSLILPFVPDWAEPVWHLFVVRSAQRDALRKQLEQEGIGTQIHYPVPPHKSDAYKQLDYEGSDLPIASRLASTLLSLPIGPQVDAKSVQYVSDTLTQLNFHNGSSCDKHRAF